MASFSPSRSVLAALCGLLLPLVALAVEDRRGEVLEATAALLEARYLDADKGRELASMLREARREGRFAGIAEPEAYASALTAALQETVPDLHLRMNYLPEREFAPGTEAEQAASRRDDSGRVRQVVRTGRIDPRTVEQIARSNFGVDRVEHLPGNIGYLKLTQFVPVELSRESLDAAIALVAHSDAVIVDLRGNIGGAPPTVGHLLSAFFSADREPVTLHASENRAMGVRSEVVTDPALSRPKLAQAPLYVLTDARTGSAAEMFAYAARRAGRATLVGENTAGAGNGATRHSVGNGFALLLSEWKVLTGPGWERIGVKPDIEVPADQALERALALAMEALAGRR